MANNVVSMNKKSKNENTSEKVEGFMSRNRLVILICVGVLVAAGIIVGLIFGLKDNGTKKVLAAIDEIEYEYTKDFGLLSEEDMAARQLAALDALSAYVGKSGASGVRANMLAGSISFDAMQFADSAAYYLKAADLQKKAYTASGCYYNAAAAYDELGDLENAEKYYLASVAGNDIAGAAYFNLGRIREQRGDYAGALEAYGSIDSSEDWYSVAMSRVILIKAEGKAE